MQLNGIRVYVAGPYTKPDPVINTKAAVEAGDPSITAVLCALHSAPDADVARAAATRIPRLARLRQRMGDALQRSLASAR